jgi:hypothetical protein
MTEAGLLPSPLVSQAIRSVLEAPPTSGLAGSDFGSALDAVVPSGQLGPDKISRPTT